ncbi:MAG: NAD-dependent epimerase/dehydratase family protein [Candidatus Abyssobacteria bacterium SURF_17]|uniref:NAD-dependent epimerase/dehydratase family protein n=1 Tax=Candidatus Abyssobacteria bacterium SURF_17 TaxID=2093361 RepID=A0A419EXP1_9BACT|nr:MAG: NAD-dependent epimerase/dehydratase family protein [Candidatus Abyssubacteria bacterium SURF_17]
MGNTEIDVVTGAFGYTGKYIARRLLSIGKTVKTLTWHPERSERNQQIQALPFNFDKPERLKESLSGATTLYNTYWVRFLRGDITYETAVENTKVLIRAAKEAGIKKFVHISITNCSEDSPLPYFRGKALVEKAIVGSDLSYAIIRPAVIFGKEDILINNIAWLLRKFPVFAVLGSGEYRIRPVFVEDVAEIAVDAAREERNKIIDAVGPETYTFNALVRLIAGIVGSSARIIHTPPSLAYILSRLISIAVGDVLLTRDEVTGLMANLLVTDGPSTGATRLSDWLRQNAASVGTSYSSELKRHYR